MWKGGEEASSGVSGSDSCLLHVPSPSREPPRSESAREPLFTALRLFFI